MKLTCTGVVALWRGDVDTVLAMCREDVSWFDADSYRLSQGKEELAKSLRGRSELRGVRLVDGRFGIAAHNGTICSVVGSYGALVPNPRRLYCRQDSIVWEQCSDDLLIRFFHQAQPVAPTNRTVPVGPMRGPGSIPRAALAARMDSADLMGAGLAHQALPRLDAEPLYGCFPLVGNESVLVPQDEVMWVAACGKSTYLRTIVNGYELRLGLSKVRERLDGRFVSVHRSYLVNPAYVFAVDRYAAAMADGTNVPISRGRYDEVAARLTQGPDERASGSR